MIGGLTLAAPVLSPRVVALLRPEIRRLHSLAWCDTQQASSFSMPSSFLPSHLFYTAHEVTHASLGPGGAKDAYSPCSAFSAGRVAPGPSERSMVGAARSFTAASHRCAGDMVSVQRLHGRQVRQCEDGAS
jgi:hypothetical protein